MQKTVTPTAATPGSHAPLVAGLNEDLAREFQAIVRYTQFAASATGPFRPEIAALFRREISDELAHAHYLAEKVVAFGGEPTTTVPTVEPLEDLREMLEAVAASERADIDHYTRRAQEAASAGEVGLKVQLENIILDETRHMEEVERILAGWTDQAGLSH